MHYTLRPVRDVLVAECVYSMSYITDLLHDRNLLFYCNSVADRKHSYKKLSDLFLHLTAEYTGAGEKTDLMLDSLLLAVLDTLMKHYRIDAESFARNVSEDDFRMREITQYISANLNQNISLTDLAEQMYLSTSTLSRLFKKNTGIYFADYVMQMRVQSSLSLLEYADQNLTQIALGCGFANSSTFSRAFRKYMNMTPTQYRETSRANA